MFLAIWAVLKVRNAIFNNFYPLPCQTLSHITEPPKVFHTLELKNPNDCPAAKCASELCRDGSIHLGL